MLDANGVLWCIVTGGAGAFFARLFSNSITGKAIAVLIAIPTIWFILSVTYTALQVHTQAQVNSWLPVTIEDFVPIAISGGAEPIGYRGAMWVRRIIGWT